jgi:hypothetical protein
VVIIAPGYPLGASLATLRKSIAERTYGNFDALAGGRMNGITNKNAIDFFNFFQSGRNVAKKELLRKLIYSLKTSRFALFFQSQPMQSHE